MEKTFLQKMRLTGGKTCFLNVPPTLEEACKMATANAGLLEQPDFILAFFIQKKDLEAELCSLKNAATAETKIWLGYPKAKQLKTDLNRDIIRELALPYGLEAVALISIDDIWSAIRVVKR